MKMVIEYRVKKKKKKKNQMMMMMMRLLLLFLNYCYYMLCLLFRLVFLTLNTLQLTTCFALFTFPSLSLSLYPFISLETDIALSPPPSPGRVSPPISPFPPVLFLMLRPLSFTDCINVA